MRSIPRPSDLRARRHPRALGRFALLVSLLFGALFVSTFAHAAGTVTLSTREPVEADGRWKLVMTIDYGSVPPIAHIPMIFSFEPKVLYERALTDKSPEKPVLNKIPLQNQTTINESMDVGFSDASGKVYKVTKFDFVIRRDHGFEAGEYELKIKRQDDGAQMGQTYRLVLKGENTVVDRRAIVFAGDKPKKAGDQRKVEEKKDEPPPAEEKKDEPADKPAEVSDPNAPPAVPPKQGGCGCFVAGDAAPANGGALAAIALGAMIALRRRRR